MWIRGILIRKTAVGVGTITHGKEYVCSSLIFGTFVELDTQFFSIRPKWRVEFLIVVDIKEGVHSEMKTFERLENCPRIQPITLIFLWKLFVLHLLSMWEGESFVWELGDFSNLVPPCGGGNMGSTNIPLNFVVKICHLTTLQYLDFVLYLVKSVNS